VTPEAKQPEPPLLEVTGLGVERDGVRLLDAVTLSVAPGAIHAVIGPNGAGKSTLVSAILGLLPFRGSVRFHWRGSGRLGFVPQTFTADRTLPVTVAEFLALPRQRWPVCLGVRPRTRLKVDALLDRVGLAGLGPRRLGVLSGGELRRVLLANALDPVPEFLLCDEPASGLDPAFALKLDELLADLRRAHGASVLLVSHDLGQVRRLADRVTSLRQTVVKTGSAAEVLA
jgi:zinc transport system ATP-binding protein